MTALYTAKATATGGREGRTKTDDGVVDFKLAKPGTSEEGANPEQLFAAGYAACFGGAMQYLAKQTGKDLGEVTIKSEVTLNKVEDGFQLSAVMDAQLPDLSREEAVALIKETHAFCPYSRATKGNIEVTLKVNGEAI